MSDSRLRLLLVEDSKADATLVLRELQHAGFKVDSTRVESEADYLAHLDLVPDIILSDYNLPQFGAMRALQLLNEQALDIPFIIVSGSIGEEVAIRAIQQGASDYLLKDRLGRLGSAVSYAIKGRQLRESKRQADAALRESQERFQLVVESAPNGLIMIDGDGQIQLVNEMTERFFGYTRAELVGKSVEMLVPERFRTIHFDHRQSFFANPSTLPMGKRTDLFGLRKDGSEFPVDIGLNPIQSPAGWLVLCAIVDITERRRTEEALRAAQRRLQHVVATSPAVLFTLAIEGEAISLIWLSENVQQMMGYTVEEALQPNWWDDGLHPDDLQRTLAEIKISLFTKGILAHEYRFRHRDGRYRWVRSELKLLRDQQSVPCEIVGSWSDITERKQLELQYRQAQKMEAFGKLAGGVAHDFNNLLTVIMGYSELGLSTLRPEDPLRVPMTEIKKAGERATGLTRQLLAFSRKQVLSPVVLDLNGILTDMERMLGRLIGEDIALSVLREKGLWHVKADPGQMEQVVMNVAVNSRDAMPFGGKLLLETKNVEIDGGYLQTHIQMPAGQYVLVAITDTGTGMDAATKARIFEPFFTTKGPTKGTGLGLATVYGIVKQSDGHVEVYSEVGQGTTIKIYLPRDKSGKASVSISRVVAPLRGGTETVLLVEDEDGIRTLAKTVLQQNGYNVIAARNGGEALLYCEAHRDPIRLLITDVIMPNLGGRQLADRLTKLRPKMKVLYMSGYTDDAIVQHGVLESGTPFLQKPFSPEALARKVREILDRE